MQGIFTQRALKPVGPFNQAAMALQQVFHAKIVNLRHGFQAIEIRVENRKPGFVIGLDQRKTRAWHIGFKTLFHQCTDKSPGKGRLATAQITAQCNQRASPCPEA